ncbi:MAG TPA: hypothetical protein VJ276_01560 [Thermoanaerobaculia bacterium]|nr:hypothetical protein [Thermoanaerobaculia bacterium]
MRQRILPIHDRRRHRRILTLKNFGIALGVAAVLFVIINIVSEVRRPKAGEYGRLVAREVPRSEIQPQTREIVAEAPVPDETSADPMLITSQARAQYLGVDNMPVVQPAAVLPPVTSEDFPSRQPLLERKHGKVTIVGDANGVALVTETTGREQKLTGGYFRQQ